MSRSESMFRILPATFLMALCAQVAQAAPQAWSADTIKTKCFSFPLPLNWYYKFPAGSDIYAPIPEDLDKAIIYKPVTGDELILEGYHRSSTVSTEEMMADIQAEGSKEGLVFMASGFEVIGKDRFGIVNYLNPATNPSKPITIFFRGHEKIEFKARLNHATSNGVDAQVLTLLANLTYFNAGVTALRPLAGKAALPLRSTHHDALGRTLTKADRKQFLVKTGNKILKSGVP